MTPAPRVAGPRLSNLNPVGIGEASRRGGLAPSAVRFYESEGLLDPPAREDGRRRYGAAELRTLAFVALARELGPGVAAVRRALHPAPSGWEARQNRTVAKLPTWVKPMRL